MTGRLTNDAEIKRTKDNRELVAFTVVDNHYYKTRDGEKKKDASFFNCAYWLGTSVAKALKKGAIVTVTGRVGINSYKKKEGDFFAHLTFHANSIKIIAGATKGTAAEAIPVGETTEDLPF